MPNNPEEKPEERDIRHLDKKKMAELLKDLIDNDDEGAETDSQPDERTEGQ
ncbi:MAG: hypothetical protein K9N62_01160 [Verrucomicrobia bacterium]|nr:hypothetical protein [Verrucomicrobiota bacterium]